MSQFHIAYLTCDNIVCHFLNYNFHVTHTKSNKFVRCVVFLLALGSFNKSCDIYVYRISVICTKTLLMKCVGSISHSSETTISANVPMLCDVMGNGIVNPTFLNFRATFHHKMELRDYEIAGAEFLTSRKRAINTEIKWSYAYVKLGKIITRRVKKNIYFRDL